MIPPIKVSVAVKENSKSMGKLIDAARDFVGAWMDPRRVVKVAKAKAEAKLITAQAQQDAKVIKRRGRANITVMDMPNEAKSLTGRAKQRLAAQETRRQGNIESIFALSVLELPNEDDRVSDEPVSKDWMNSFFDACQDVSDTTMQTLFARILAGEVTVPGTFSRRTIHIMRQLDQAAAARFQRISGFAWNLGGERAVLSDPSGSGDWLNKLGSSSDDLLSGMELGLIHYGSNLSTDVPSNGVVEFGDKRFKLQGLSGWSVGTYPLTDSGRQIYAICGHQTNLDYLAISLQFWKAHGFAISELAADE